MPNCISRKFYGQISGMSISLKPLKVMQKEKEGMEKRENRSKQIRRDMRKRLNMRSLYAILLLAFSGMIFAQEDSLQVEKDSVIMDSVQPMPELQPTQDISQAGYTNPQTYMLADLELSGESRFTKNQIMRFTGLRLGEKLEIPGTKINNALKKLWKSNLFSDIDLYVAKTEGDKIYLRLNLVGLPELVEPTFNGVKKGKREDFIKEHKLDPGIKITSNLKNQVRNSIRNHFLEKGYPDTKVDFIEKKQEDDPSKVDLTINVDKGERVKIQKIEFEGNEELRDGQLRRKAMKNTKKKSINIFRGSKFIPSKYQEDLKKVIEEYKSIGFRDAKIVSDTVMRVNPKNIAIKVTVEEGKPYYLGDVTFTGNSVFSTEVLERVFSYQKGD